MQTPACFVYSRRHFQQEDGSIRRAFFMHCETLQRFVDSSTTHPTRLRWRASAGTLWRWRHCLCPRYSALSGVMTYDVCSPLNICHCYLQSQHSADNQSSSLQQPSLPGHTPTARHQPHHYTLCCEPDLCLTHSCVVTDDWPQNKD